MATIKAREVTLTEKLLRLRSGPTVRVVPEIGTEPSKSLVYTPVFTPFFPCLSLIPDRIPDRIQGVPPFHRHGGGQKSPADTSGTAGTHQKLILKKLPTVIDKRGSAHPQRPTLWR